MSLKKRIRALLPRRVISAYHFSIAQFSAFLFRHPSRQMLVIGVTGTKGKSSVTEMVNVILEEAHYHTAVLNSIRVKIGHDSRPNLMRMSMPGRFYIQRFLYRALHEECDAVVLEMTSEGAAQHRHRGIALDALIFTNLAPEHIESHGSYEAYADAKFSLGRALERSRKRERYMVANADDAQSPRYLALKVEHPLPFSLSYAEPWEAGSDGGYFTFEGQRIVVNLPGEFSLKNALAAATLCRAIGVRTEVIARALGRIRRIPGRAERVDAGQRFEVIVDYAHTPDSLEALYSAYEKKRKICVLGSMGGGRDTWNRPVKAKLASTYCAHTILTNEDPVDEDPEKILEQMKTGLVEGSSAEVIVDRRAAIAKALSMAHDGDAVLITGKGTDPTMYGPNGTSIPWSDAKIVREELERLGRL